MLADLSRPHRDDESSVAAHMEANIMACSIGESSRSYDVGLLTTGLLAGTCPTRYVAAIMSTSIAPACVSIDCRQPITGLCSARPRQVFGLAVGRRNSRNLVDTKKVLLVVPFWSSLLDSRRNDSRAVSRTVLECGCNRLQSLSRVSPQGWCTKSKHQKIKKVEDRIRGIDGKLPPVHDAMLRSARQPRPPD